MWRAGIGKQIEVLINSCDLCQTVVDHSAFNKAPLNPTVMPRNP